MKMTNDGIPRTDGDELPFGREQKLEARVMRVFGRSYEEIAERFGVDRDTAYRLVEAGGQELPTDRWERGALISKIGKQLPKPRPLAPSIKTKALKRIERKPSPLLKTREAKGLRKHP